MSAIKVNFEIGHETSLRTKKTPEGFTHDWEVFLRGQEGVDISHFVDKVVFNLHETFPRPKRVVKEPPFSVKESGYAGFMILIEIYLKNKDEPKRITFNYDLNLAHGGVLKDRYIFQNPNDEFRKKLLKGGGIITPLTNNTFYTNPDQENKSRDSFTNEKPPSKSKLPSDSVKKHKSKEHKEELPHRTSSFENLFGPPIQKPPKVSPDPKKLEKSSTVVKPDKKEKDKSSSDKKSKYENKELKPEKAKLKEEKEKIRPEKVKSHSKEPERSKEKSKKRQSDRPPSPEVPKKRLAISPSRKVASPVPRSSSASSIKEEYKPPKHSTEPIEHKKPKIEEKPPKIEEVKPDKDLKEKKKKEKKSHDKDKERKEKKEHKKESHKIKETPKEIIKEIPKPREIPKEKEIIKEPVREKPIKPEKPINKFSIENLRKSPPPENEERSENHKSKEKGESERKHKHKKKDKKRDESKEKHKDSSKEKKHKHDKNKEMPPEKPEVIERRETPTFKERPLPEPASPISLDTASQCSSKSGVAKMSHIGAEDIHSSHSDSESSMIADEEDTKVKTEVASPVRHKREPSPEPEPEPELEPEPEPEPEPGPVVEAPVHKEKVKKHKDKKDKKEEKRRKRKANEEGDADKRKLSKSDTGPSNHETECGESSGSIIETKVQDNGVSSSLGEDAEPGDLSPDYMVQLKGLQKRIMMIKNNEELERVVNLIAETGRYEVTTQTFDFDLCLLDRSTVQQLIQLVGC
ncbi:protein AF-9-like [Cydia amplana]|uniref:protein AF-9-like n=1 Tax=Cydia amplana TaxID=1869771 RepID=UPI002FE5FB3F